MFRNVKYFISQGVKGLTSNSLMTLASIGTVVASLIIFGFFLLFGLNLASVGEQVKEQCEITVFMPREMERDDVRSIGSQLEELEYVKEIRLYSKEERYQKNLEGVYKEQADVIEILEKDNPLRDAYVLTLTNVKKAEQVAEAARRIEGVEAVSNRQDIINQVLSITSAVKHVSAWLLVILAIISIFIISNTIKLGMFSRRKEINIMKFVGATNWFIRWPFVIEGMILGAIGAGIASAIVVLGYESFLPGIQSFMGDIEIIKISEISTTIIASFMTMGIVIGMVGSAMSIRKHLHV